MAVGLKLTCCCGGMYEEEYGTQEIASWFSDALKWWQEQHKDCVRQRLIAMREDAGLKAMEFAESKKQHDEEVKRKALAQQHEDALAKKHAEEQAEKERIDHNYVPLSQRSVVTMPITSYFRDSILESFKQNTVLNSLIDEEVEQREALNKQPDGESDGD